MQNSSHLVNALLVNVKYNFTSPSTRLDRELATGWENRELESSNYRKSPEAVLIDFQ
jgi:hypothetical protein